MRRLMAMLLAAVLAVLLAATLSACAVLQTGTVLPVTGRVCDRVPQAVCASELANAERNGPAGAGDVIGIEVRCTAATCTDEAGEASIRVTYANGQTIASGTGWAGAAPAPVGQPVEPTPLPVEPVCRAVPEAWCKEMAASGDATPGGPPVVSIVVSCTGVCTLDAGEGETRFTYADGSTGGSSWNYSGDPAPESP